MKNLLKIKLVLLCVFVLCILSYQLGRKTEQKKQSNEIVFVWDGLEEDIPEDGDQLINLSTNENVVHLNPAD